MQVRLKVMHGVNAGKEILVPGNKFFIGRGPECHLRPKSDAISRHHCALLITATQVAVRDFGSKNGTYVNDQRVQDIGLVRPGDVLRVGPLVFEINYQPQEVPAPQIPNVNEVASKTGGNKEDWDVTDWLNDDDDSQVKREIAEPETRQFRLDETDRVMLDSSETTTTNNSANETTAAEPAKEDTAEKKSKKAKPGKLPKVKSVNSADSRSAADEALRRYFNRG